MQGHILMAAAGEEEEDPDEQQYRRQEPLPSLRSITQQHLPTQRSMPQQRLPRQRSAAQQVLPSQRSMSQQGLPNRPGVQQRPLSRLATTGRPMRAAQLLTSEEGSTSDADGPGSGAPQTHSSFHPAVMSISAAMRL